MSNKVNNKLILVVVLVVLLALLWYGFVDTGTTSVETDGGPRVGTDLIEMTMELANARLDQSLFTEPNYLYLIDFSTIVPPQPLGRTNPFDAIGR